MQPARYLTAREAAATLQVSVATIYAYVSRGLIRSESDDAGHHTKRYLVEDVQKLRDQKIFRHDPEQVATHAMHWGAPVLESALTHITDKGLWYRGQDAVQLAMTSTAEQVAALLWEGDMERAAGIFAHPPQAILAQVRPHIPSNLMPLQRLQMAMTLASAHDLAAYDLDLRFDNVVRTGGRILPIMAGVLAGQHDITASLAEILCAGWCPNESHSVALFNAALILCADHELNTSSFAARVVASAEAHLYLVVTAGLSAIQGFKHGGHTGLVEVLLREVETPEQAEHVITARLRRGICIPGFGHRLYPQGDPRGAALLQLSYETFGNTPTMQRIQSVVANVQNITGKQPTLEFGLVTLAQAMGLPDGSGLALFALGRTIGWIGHAIEQYRSGQIIRPRAKYIGM